MSSYNNPQVQVDGMFLLLLSIHVRVGGLLSKIPRNIINR